MSVISMILYKWHYIRLQYHEFLLEGCLDERIKHNLIKKIKYHQIKLNEINSSR